MHLFDIFDGTWMHQQPWKLSSDYFGRRITTFYSLENVCKFYFQKCFMHSGNPGIVYFRKYQRTPDDEEKKNYE